MDLQDIKKGLDSLKFNNNDVIRKAKYIRREGTKGNYKYIYNEDQGSKGSSKKEEDIISTKKVGDIIEHNGKKYKKQGNGKWVS